MLFQSVDFVTGLRRFATAVVAVAFVECWPIVATAQDSAKTLAREDIERVILAGPGNAKAFEIRTGSMGGGFAGDMMRRTGAGHAILISGPKGRVATALAEHAKNYLPFTADSVTLAMTAPYVSVFVEPTTPKPVRGRVEESLVVSRVVLIPRSGDRTPIQPSALATSPVEWSNLAGGSIRGQSVVARFSLLSMPVVDFEIVVIVEGREEPYRYKVGADDLRAIM